MARKNGTAAFGGTARLADHVRSAHQLRSQSASECRLSAGGQRCRASAVVENVQAAWSAMLSRIGWCQ